MPLNEIGVEGGGGDGEGMPLVLRKRGYLHTKHCQKEDGGRKEGKG